LITLKNNFNDQITIATKKNTELQSLYNEYLAMKNQLLDEFSKS
jgi:hypothetical protein